MEEDELEKNELEISNTDLLSENECNSMNQKDTDKFFDTDLDAEEEMLAIKRKKQMKKVKPVEPEKNEIEFLSFTTYEIRTMGPENLCKNIESFYLLKHLNLSNSELGKLDHLDEVIQTCFERYCLETFDLSNNGLSDKTAEYIAKGIKETTSLLELNVSHNRFAEKAALAIGEAIGKNESILHLNISWNLIRAKSSVVFTKAITRNKRMTSLDVSWNGFGYEGALAVSEYLKRNRTILSLDMTNNRIDWKAASLLAEALGKNQTLRSLKLDENPLTTNGAMEIIEAIDANPKSALTYLGLKKVPVIGEFEMAVLYLQNKKDFKVEHGGVVSSPDVAGYKEERRVTALEKVIDFMKEKKMRKTEFFRYLDINTEGAMDSEKLRERLKKTNAGLPEHEITELISVLLDEKNNAIIDFQKISSGMRDFNDKQRLGKINEVDERTKTKQLHQKILST